MIHGEKNTPVDEFFTVTDRGGNLITGIDPGDFDVLVYNPDGNEVSSSVSGSFQELGNGNYRYVFTPDENGIWYVVVTHATYFPWGKTDDVVVDEKDLTAIYESVSKTLGLVHHNIYIDEADYDEFGNMISARLRIYSDKNSVGTDNDVIETYLIKTDGVAPGQFTFWQQTQV